LLAYPHPSLVGVAEIGPKVTGWLLLGMHRRGTFVAMRRRVPWFVVAAFVLAFLAGGLTVALCAIALLVYVPVATIRWWSQKGRGQTQ
jgi:hypothetical protein